MEKSTGVERIARHYLDKNGFKHALLGFEYLITALTVCEKSPEFRHQTCRLYEAVAQEHKTTATRAERAIRHSIERADIGKVSNSEFIARALDDLKEETESNDHKNDMLRVRPSGAIHPKKRREAAYG